MNAPRLLACAVCALVVACGGPRPAPMMPSSDGAVGVEAVAPGVYVIRGADAAPTPENRGQVANVGIIIGSTGVTIIGTGTSSADGERLLATVARLTDKPVVLAIDTYAAPEHVLGNAAFARRGIAIAAHRSTASYMERNCENCIAALIAQVGTAALDNTKLQLPSRLVDQSEMLTVGGRTIELWAYGPAQQPANLAVFDRASGTLFTGALASFGVIPDAHEANVPGWLDALAALRKLPLKTVVPGRGPIGVPTRLDELADYLRALANETQRAYDAGIGLAEATNRVDLPAFRAWANYASTHRRNVHFLYLQAEARELGAQPAQRAD